MCPNNTRRVGCCVTRPPEADGIYRRVDDPCGGPREGGVYRAFQRGLILPLLWGLAWSSFASPAAVVAPAVPDSVNPSTRFSSLARITRDNVDRLRLAFTFRTGRLGAQGSAPLVWRTKLLLLSSFPHTLFALDLTRSGGAVSWQLTPAANRLADGLHCCDRIHLGPIAQDNRVYFSTFDGHVMAVDPQSGRPVWDTAVADPALGETLASAPTVVEDRLVVGNAGDDFGARGWIAALDIATGQILWKRYSTGPDPEVGVTPAFKPSQPQDVGTDLGSHSWPGTNWQHGGGSVSGWILYDPALHLLFHNTGPPAPWNPEPRPGDNLWTAGVFARDPRTGAARWFTDLHPHSLYGWRNGNANLVWDHLWDGTARSLLIHPDADGRLYVLDRRTGEILAADSFITHARAGLPSSGPRTDSQVRDICPAWVGAIGGEPALDESTGWLYIPVSRLCMDLEDRNANYLQGTAFIGANVRVAAEGGSRGGLVAWDIAARKKAWSHPEPFPVASDALVTAGGVVFYGTLEGTLKAVDAQTGALLWQFKTAAAITGQPTTYEGPDGQQYIAVVAGDSGPYGLAQQAWIDRRDATAARGLARVIAEVAPTRDPSGTLYVFGLP